MKIDKNELHYIFTGIAVKEEKKFELLYEKYYKLVYKIAFSILKNKENSEDVVQKVFIKIWKLDKEKLPTCSEASWLYALVKNESLNYIRNKKDEIDIEDVYYLSDEDEELNELMDKDTYNRTISRLNREEQEIISLKILSSLSFREISQILNIPIGTVQWKYYKSMNTLKGLITNCSIFIISIGIFFAERRVSKNKKSVEADFNITTNIENSIQFIEQIKDKEDDERKVFNQTKDSTYNFNNLNEVENNCPQDNAIFDEKMVNNIQLNEIANNIQIDSSPIKKLNWIETGTIVISAMFFIITLSYFIIYLKLRKKEKHIIK